ncbi:MAG: hypothetical protein QMD99_17360 [Rhizobiaceae bacterium]|nr:hypothetical protein [Rhizobiaceae bacterium]
MAKIIRKETRKRGIFGWLFLLLFIGFNLLMIAWLVNYWSILSDVSSASEAEFVGRAIGGTIGSGMLITLWALGDIILGSFVLLTRGRKVIVEETVA